VDLRRDVPAPRYFIVPEPVVHAMHRHFDFRFPTEAMRWGCGGTDWREWRGWCEDDVGQWEGRWDLLGGRRDLTTVRVPIWAKRPTVGTQS
jgi:hypothetical protein